MHMMPPDKSFWINPVVVHWNEIQIWLKNVREKVEKSCKKIPSKKVPKKSLKKIKEKLRKSLKK